jgi:hypothetical protein
MTPTSFVDVWALSDTSAQEKPWPHCALDRQGARQLLGQNVHVDWQMALLQSEACLQLDPWSPVAVDARHANAWCLSKLAVPWKGPSAHSVPAAQEVVVQHVSTHMEAVHTPEAQSVGAEQAAPAAPCCNGDGRPSTAASTQ